MDATLLAQHLRTASDMCSEADMPADPFEAADILDACKTLGAGVAHLAARVRAERVANANAWAEWEQAELDKGTKPPPPPPPPDPEPKPAPPADDPPPSQPPTDRGRA